MQPASAQDWFAIHGLFIRYTRALDDGDPDGVAACFHPDGVVDSPLIGRCTGHAAIRAFARRTAQKSAETGGQFRHMVSNLVAETQGDLARARCYFLDLFTEAGKTVLLTPGDYLCTLSRRGGPWLFDERKVVLDQTFPLRL
jgi:hypothetical protein